MKHINDLMVLGFVLKAVLNNFDADISKIKDPKHLCELRQEFDKALHWTTKMLDSLDDLDTWLTAFGPGASK